MMLKEEYDVLILGGGLAGLTLARQLKRARADLRILVAEKRRHPAPEAAFKVGESTIEVGAHYYNKILDMEDHLHLHQLPKLGLRFFFTAGDNSDIARRAEVGPFGKLPVPAFQLDRGRFENALATDNLQLGVDFLDDCKVKNVSLGSDRHTVTLLHQGEEKTVSGRWVVDASGRAFLLKRLLNLRAESKHNINAAWFRIGERIDIDDWSRNPRWRSRLFPGLRRLSTNHLMGKGYWVWLIPLASEATSVGIVADAALHPFNTINRFDRAMEWLWQYEPQCARVIESKRDKLQDFLVLKHYAHDCRQVFSADRWCISGEAGVFTDPLYSVGSDFIAMGNTFITDLILRDLRGEPLNERVDAYSWFFLDFWYQTTLGLYLDQYPIMGNPQVMAAKIVWDYLIYWGTYGLIFFREKLCDLEFIESVRDLLDRVKRLNERMQALFREWDVANNTTWVDACVDYGNIEFLRELQAGLAADLSDDQLKAKLTINLALCETVAAEMFRKAATLVSLPVNGEAINPYAVTLDSGRWSAEGLFLNAHQDASAELPPGFHKIWFDLMATGKIFTPRPLSPERNFTESLEL